MKAFYKVAVSLQLIVTEDVNVLLISEKLKQM